MKTLNIIVNNDKITLDTEEDLIPKKVCEDAMTELFIELKNHTLDNAIENLNESAKITIIELQKQVHIYKIAAYLANFMLIFVALKLYFRW